MEYNEKLKQKIAELGISEEEVSKQLKQLKDGFPYIRLVSPATIDNGIQRIPLDQNHDYITRFDHFEGKILKFVPASGAASRMFKKLFEFVEQYDKTSKEADQLLANTGLQSMGYFIENIHAFAFYESLSSMLEIKGLDINELVTNRDYDIIINALLEEDGLNYGQLPKGLLLFHTYGLGYRTAFEEHLAEAAEYATKNGAARLHFTVSPEHEEAFMQLYDAVKAGYQKEFHVTYDVDFSNQLPSTDTIAVTMENEPFVMENDEVLFRPGGHGALLSNLQMIDADLIFIKNIDNVVPDRLKASTITYKKLLGGLLLEIREKVYAYQQHMEESPESAPLDEIKAFVTEKLGVRNMGDDLSGQELHDFLRRKLFRPIRVCGMVLNEGEPGGGPFWAVNTDETVSLQIVESAQIDPDDAGQQEIVAGATHFNPVDIVCCIHDYKGRKYDLKQFVDETTGFIARKSKDGRDLKALELPGLWNGAMSDWSTLFVEVPAITFNPVKTVNDLLREEHQ